MRRSFGSSLLLPDGKREALEREQQTSESQRLDTCEPSSSSARCNPQSDRVAYVPAYLLNATDREWRQRKGRPGADAPCQQPLYTRGLYTGADPSEAARATATWCR